MVRVRAQSLCGLGLQLGFELQLWVNMEVMS